MNEILFLVFNFLIGFFSDIVLNILANQDIQFLKSLKPYFANKSVSKAALYAGITVVIIVGIIMSIFQLTYDKYLPETVNEYFIYLLISFVIGFIADIVIYKINIFPKFKLYYQKVGKGLWGSLAILFSVITSLIGLYLYQNKDIWIQKVKKNWMI
jgi:H+/Cl- antiporter ClcA